MSNEDKHNRFNGHTWIVAIVAISAYLAIAVLEIIVGYEIIKITTSLWMRIIVKGAIITVPLQMGFGIKSLMKRLTYNPKEDKTPNCIHLSWKERITGQRKK